MRTQELGPYQTPNLSIPSPWTFQGSGLYENSLDRHSPSKLTQDLTARIPKQLLSDVQPASSRWGCAFCSHSLASCASTLPPAKGTGSCFQPLHTHPACMPPGHFPHSPGHRELSNIHFHSALTILYAAKLPQSCPTLCDPIDGSPTGSPVPRILRQEHWNGLPFPSPMHESEKWKWSHSVMSDSLWPHGLQPTRLLRPWDFPGKSTAVGCHCLLQLSCIETSTPWFSWPFPRYLS